MKTRQYKILVATLFCFGLAFFIKVGQGQTEAAQQGVAGDVKSNVSPRPDYVLGSDDEISIFARDAEEISNKPMRIDGTGNINLPMLGRVRAAGLTVKDLEAEIEAKLRTYVLEPEVTISITAYRSQPVSIIGSVRNPGVFQLEGHKTLIEVLSFAGGLSSDAGNILKITRRMQWGEIPLPNATVNETAEYSTAELSLRSLMEARTPDENITVMPNDVLTVPRGQMIYVIGEVAKPGGFVVPERESTSVLQLLAMAGGLTPTAASKQARIIRPVAGSNRIEIALDIKSIMAGKKADTILQPEDILLVPNSFAKSAWRRTLDTALSTITSVAIYRGW